MKLHKELTVIVGENGSGKSSIVSAIRLLLWAYVKNYGKDVRRGTVPSIKMDDVFLKGEDQQYPCSVKGEVWFPEEDFFQDDWDAEDPSEFDELFNFNIIGCELSDRNSRPKWDGVAAVNYQAASKGMDAAFEHLDRLLGGKVEPSEFPVIACYGTNRLWKKRISYRKPPRVLDRLAGYDGAADLTTSFMSFDTFIVQIFSSVRGGALDKNNIEQLWLGVKDAIFLVTGWKLLLPRQGETEIFFQQQGTQRLKLSQLGDGVRCMIEFIGDLACRCALLNPHHGRGASVNGCGVVLIDEIDLHLHPHWQQTIISQLQKAFPKIQFIVTTHSPQVLSTVRRKNVRVLGVDGNNKAVASQPMAHTYGEPSGDVLQGVMLVDPQPPVPEKVALQQLTSLVDQGQYDEPASVKLMHELTLALGTHHPQLQRLKRSIERQRVLRK